MQLTGKPFSQSSDNIPVKKIRLAIFCGCRRYLFIKQPGKDFPVPYDSFVDSFRSPCSSAGEHGFIGDPWRMCHGLLSPLTFFLKFSEEIDFSFAGCLITLAGRNESIMNKIPLETNDGESTIRFRDCFSVRYIQSAALLCRLGYEIEQMQGKTGILSPDSLLRHEVFILNSLLSSVAFLESTINELYADAADDAYFFSDEKKEALLRTIREKWKNQRNFDRASLITRYQKILNIAKKPLFDENNPGFSDVRHLVEIRNYLMHYRREWVIVQNDEEVRNSEETHTEKFEKLLKNKFLQNPFAHKNQPFFPDKLLGHGCAEWAIRNSLEFTDEFFKNLELPAPYDGIKNELVTR